MSHHDSRRHGRHDDDAQRDDRDYDSREYDAAGDSDAWDAIRDDEPRHGASSRALAPIGERALTPTVNGETAPIVVPGTGRSMGNPFVRRRERPLTLRLATIILIACIITAGLFTVTPLGSSANSTTIQQLASSIVLNPNTGYRWYVTKPGDTPESIAAKFGVQVGGIYELNDLIVGQDLAVGVPLKVPEDPHFGTDYRAPSLGVAGTGGNATTFGSDWYLSNAGLPLPEQPCAPDGGANPLGYKFQSPNPGSYFVRGYSWFHNGVDIAQPAGAPIYAAQSGVVIWAGWTNTGFGFSVVISHCYFLSTLYGHMAKLLVHAGEFVQVGQQIGVEGMTGWATGPHLHLSVLVHGQFVNPLLYFKSIYTLTHRT